MASTNKSAVLLGATVAFGIALCYLYWRVEALVTDVAILRESVVAEIGKLREAAPKPAPPDKRVAAELQRVEALRRELEQKIESAGSEATTAAAKARQEAVRYAERMIRQLNDEQMSQRKEVVSEIGQVKTTTHARIDDVSADVESIRSEVASTRMELERTVADLKRVRGDLGVQSGLIATNARELEALKMLGERNYFDFHLVRGKQPQRVGDISVVLRRTDPKSNRYSIEVLVADQKVEKKEKGVNEPVQFYVKRGQLPYEIVVNDIQKEHVAGYLATPKELESGPAEAAFR